MKWNWGTGIVVAILLFMSFILFFVIKMSINKEYDHDLVTEEYYAKEMLYQTEIDAEKNTINLKDKIKSKKTEQGWLLVFPKEFEPSKIKGKIYIYRPSNKKLDFEIPLNLESSNLVIPKKNMLEGIWNITLDWTYNNTHYLYKEKITY